MLERLTRFIEHNWYQPTPGWNYALLPLWLLAAPFILLKRWRAQRNPVATLKTPVVVVGNITVGGTGKTPLITWLVKRVESLGYRAAIVSRGYGGEAEDYPLMVQRDTPVSLCGDEPKLLQRRLNCPVVVDPLRRRAVELLNGEVDIIFSDDGLQHYGMGRNAEILVVDAQRGFGNGWLLPVGPLREPLNRAKEVDLVLQNGQDFNVIASRLVNAKDGREQPLEWLRGRELHAVAGIGNPQRFYNTLAHHGARVQQHSFADHHQFSVSDLLFDDQLPVVMTEKDWVKCAGFARQHMWYLVVDADLAESSAPIDQLLQRLLQADERDPKSLTE